MRMLVGLPAALATLLVFATAVQSMSNYKWKKRPLVVFAESDGSPLLAEQRQIVSRYRSDLNKRDVVVVWVVAEPYRPNLARRPAATRPHLEPAIMLRT